MQTAWIAKLYLLHALPWAATTLSWWYTAYSGCAGYMLHLLSEHQHCISCNTSSSTLPFQEIELAAAKAQAKGFEAS